MIRKKVLLVDDSPTALLWQRTMLGDEPYDILEATDGEQCLRIARAEHPDLVLMDVMMPRMDGFEALRLLRADQSLCGTPVVMVTTRGESTSVAKGFAIGCNEYITKPLDRTEFRSVVRTCLGDYASAA